MPTYEINLPVPGGNIDHLVEIMRQYAGVDSIKVTIEADGKREAVNAIGESLFEFRNTYVNSSYSQNDAIADARAGLKLVPRS